MIMKEPKASDIKKYLYGNCFNYSHLCIIGAKQETVNLTVNNGGWHNIKPLSLSKPCGCIQSFFVLITS